MDNLSFPRPHAGACRQLASSARRRIAAARPSATPTAVQAGLVRDFKRAWEARDVDALVAILDPDAVAIADGGGVAAAQLDPMEGDEQIGRACVEFATRTPALTLVERTVNGQPGLVAQLDGVTVTVYAFAVADDRITHIWAMRNPDKLRLWMTGTY